MSSSPSPSSATTTNPFDPLTDIVGLSRDDDDHHHSPSSTFTTSTNKNHNPPFPIVAASHSNRNVHMRPSVDQSTDDRINAAKRFISDTSNGTAQQQHNHSFGVTGANRHSSLHPQLAQQEQQRYYQQQQQQQAMMMQMQMYNTMAMYNSTMTAAAYSTVNVNMNMQYQQQLVPYNHQHVMPMMHQHNGALVSLSNINNKDAARIAPPMQTRTRASIDPTAFRVQRRAAEKEFVSEDDKAFKPLFEEFKASFTTTTTTK